jgi:hypothetical protein
LSALFYLSVIALGMAAIGMLIFLGLAVLTFAYIVIMEVVEGLTLYVIAPIAIWLICSRVARYLRYRKAKKPAGPAYVDGEGEDDYDIHVQGTRYWPEMVDVLRPTFCSTPLISAKPPPKNQRRSGTTHVVPQESAEPDAAQASLKTKPTGTDKKVNHTHPEEANSRSNAGLYCEDVLARCGLRPWFFQMSKHDQRHDRRGYRDVRWDKDRTAEARSDTLTEVDVPVMIDVDYYVDIPRWLYTYRRPLMLYTFVPDVAANGLGASPHCFTHEGEVDVRVHGGAHYQHMLWDYSSDVITAREPLCVPYLSPWRRFKDWLFGRETRSATYHIDRKKTGPNRVLVCFTPISVTNTAEPNCIVRFQKRLKHAIKRLQWWKPHGSAQDGDDVESSEIERLQPVVGCGEEEEFIVLNKSTPEGMYTSIARPWSHSCATVPKHLVDTLRAYANNTRQAISLYSVEGRANDAGIQLSDEAKIVLVDYIRNGPEGQVYIPGALPGLYTYTFSKYHVEEAKPSLGQFMQPLYGPETSPADGKESEAIGVRERVIKPGERPAPVMTPFLLRVISEFVDRVVDDARYTLYPVDDSEVFERQPRPSQQAILEEASWTSKARLITKAFVKRETYGGKVTAPRIISTMPAKDKLEYAKFMYSFADHMKSMPWYAFGKPPCEIAARVAEICRSAEIGALPSDFSKMDGHVSELMRSIEQKVALALFAPEHHPELSRLMQRQYNMKGVTRNGVKYRVGTQRCSGSLETSPFNTLANAFVNFLAWRCTKQRGMYVQADEAWSRLGVYGGDDGLTADLPAQALRSAGAMVGFPITGESIPRGEIGVNFLSRFYGPDVWCGDPNSICDVQRQLRKLHLTVVTPDRPAIKLAEKVRSFVATDVNTPVIGPFVRKAYLLANGSYHNTGNIRDELSEETNQRYGTWWGRFDKEVNWPNQCSSWADAYVAEVSVPRLDVSSFLKWLEQCMSVDDLMACPGFYDDTPPVATIAAVIDGERVGPNPKPQPKPAKAGAAKPKAAPKKRREAKEGKEPRATPREAETKQVDDTKEDRPREVARKPPVVETIRKSKPARVAKGPPKKKQAEKVTPPKTAPPPPKVEPEVKKVEGERKSRPKKKPKAPSKDAGLSEGPVDGQTMEPSAKTRNRKRADRRKKARSRSRGKAHGGARTGSPGRPGGGQPPQPAGEGAQ